MEEAGEIILKRLDKDLQLVLKAIKKKLTGRVKAVECGKVTQSSYIRQGHLNSENLKENSYSISEITKDEKGIDSDKNKTMIHFYLRNED